MNPLLYTVNICIVKKQAREYKNSLGIVILFTGKNKKCGRSFISNEQDLIHPVMTEGLGYWKPYNGQQSAFLDCRWGNQDG